MNPYEVMGLIACCASLFAAVMTFLVFQGVPFPAALLLVYLAAVGCMLGMQRRARESRGVEESRHAARERPTSEPPRADTLRVSSVSLRKTSGL